MNQRIQELYTQALENKFDYGGGRGVKPGEYYSNYKTVLNAEKFAELIVQETIKQMAIQMDKFGDDQSNNPAWYKSEEAVKKHFGVEESLGWVCSKCGTDRTKAVCPQGPSASVDGRCPMIASAQ